MHCYYFVGVHSDPHILLADQVYKFFVSEIVLFEQHQYPPNELHQEYSNYKDNKDFFFVEYKVKLDFQ